MYTNLITNFVSLHILICRFILNFHCFAIIIVQKYRWVNYHYNVIHLHIKVAYSSGIGSIPYQSMYILYYYENGFFNIHINLITNFVLLHIFNCRFILDFHCLAIIIVQKYRWVNYHYIHLHAYCGCLLFRHWSSIATEVIYKIILIVDWPNSTHCFQIFLMILNFKHNSCIVIACSN